MNDLDEKTPVNIVNGDALIPVGIIGEDMGVMHISTLIDYTLTRKNFISEITDYSYLPGESNNLGASKSDGDTFRTLNIINIGGAIINRNVKDKGYYTWNQSTNQWDYDSLFRDVMRQSDNVNNLTSNDANKPLAAVQGKLLNAKITNLENTQPIRASDHVREGNAYYYKLPSPADDATQWQINRFIGGVKTTATIANNASYNNINDAWTVKDQLNYS